MIAGPTRIKRNLWVLAIGVIVAALAGTSAGFRLEDGSLVSRGVPLHAAQLTLLVSSPRDSAFQAGNPPQTLEPGQTAATQSDLGRTALIYAYLAMSAPVAEQVEEAIGSFADDEAITAMQRTTQPADNEPDSIVTSQNRISLPILAISATASTPDRAIEIVEAGGDVLRAQVAQEQADRGIAVEFRTEITSIDLTTTMLTTGSPIVPIAVTAGGVLAAFAALILFMERATRRTVGRREAVRSARQQEPTQIA